MMTLDKFYYHIIIWFFIYILKTTQLLSNTFKTRETVSQKEMSNNGILHSHLVFCYMSCVLLKNDNKHFMDPLHVLH